MQDLPSIRENATSVFSHISETEFEYSSTPKLVNRLPPLRTDPAATPKTTQRSQKNSGYAPPVSDREGWWRMTIKVRRNVFHLYEYRFSFAGYTESRQL